MRCLAQRDTRDKNHSENYKTTIRNCQCGEIPRQWGLPAQLPALQWAPFLQVGQFCMHIRVNKQLLRQGCKTTFSFMLTPPLPSCTTSYTSLHLMVEGSYPNHLYKYPYQPELIIMFYLVCLLLFLVDRINLGERSNELCSCQGSPAKLYIVHTRRLKW